MLYIVERNYYLSLIHVKYGELYYNISNYSEIASIGSYELYPQYYSLWEGGRER